MKMITNDTAYVQLSDISSLNPLDIEVPVSIFAAVFREKLKEEENNNIFLEFDDKDAIKYLKKAKWIIDYDKYKNCSIDELELLILKISDRYSKLANFFNSREITNQKINKIISDKFFIMEKEVDGLNELILYKQGVYDLELPDGYINASNSKKLIRFFK